MISKKVFNADGTNKRFLSDFIIQSEQFVRVYAYIYDNTLNPDGTEDKLQSGSTDQADWSFPDNIWKRGADVPDSGDDLVTIDKWDLVTNSILMYDTPLAPTKMWLEVATTPEEFGDTLTQPSVQRAEDAADVAIANTALTSADVVLTHADVVLTHADVLTTSNKLPKDGSEPMTGNLEAPSVTLDGDYIYPYVADRLELLTKIGTREGEVVLQRDLGLLYAWTNTQGIDNGGTILNVESGSWLAQYSGPINVKWFGALGDNTGAIATTLAFKNAIALNESVYIPKGTYNLNEALVFPHNYSAEFYGERSDSHLKNYTTNLFDFEYMFSGVLRDLQLTSGDTGGHVFNIPERDGTTGSNGIATARLSNLLVYINNPAKSLLNFIQPYGTVIYKGVYIDVLVDNFNIFATPLHPTPIVNVDVAGGHYGANTWERGRVTYGGVHTFKLICKDPNSYLFDNIIRDVNFELTVGGNIFARGVNNLNMENLYIYDTDGISPATDITGNVYDIGKDASGLASAFITFSNCQRRSSTLGAGISDIRFGTNEVTGALIDNCQDATKIGFTIDVGSCVDVEIKGYRGSSILTNPSASTYYTVRNSGTFGAATKVFGNSKIMAAQDVPTTTSHVAAGGELILRENTDGNGSSLWVREAGLGFTTVQSSIAKSAAQLNDVTNSINSVGKLQGKQVFNTTTLKPVYAVGGAAVSVWYYADGSTANTPV